MAAPRVVHEETIDGIRVRVYARRTEYEVLLGEGSINDPQAEVWAFPKVGTPSTWAHQAVLNQGRA